MLFYFTMDPSEQDLQKQLANHIQQTSVDRMNLTHLPGFSMNTNYICFHTCRSTAYEQLFYTPWERLFHAFIDVSGMFGPLDPTTLSILSTLMASSNSKVSVKFSWLMREHSYECMALLAIPVTDNSQGSLTGWSEPGVLISESLREQILPVFARGKSSLDSHQPHCCLP